MKTNAMHFLFCLLRMKDLYMFRALFAHPQSSGGATQTVLGMLRRVMSVGWIGAAN
jgi:hypothetical protein